MILLLFVPKRKKKNAQNPCGSGPMFLNTTVDIKLMQTLSSQMDLLDWTKQSYESFLENWFKLGEIEPHKLWFSQRDVWKVESMCPHVINFFVKNFEFSLLQGVKRNNYYSITPAWNFLHSITPLPKTETSFCSENLLIPLFSQNGQYSINIATTKFPFLLFRYSPLGNFPFLY